MTKFRMEDFEFIPLTEELRNCIVQGRAAEIRAKLGAQEAAYFIIHQSEISVELKGKYLVFADSVIVHSSAPRDQSVLCVHWNIAGWCGHFYHAAIYWEDALLVRYK